MPWLELSVTLNANRQAQFESALADLGALSITLCDADAETPDERAILEPGVGETPLWTELVLQALFAANTDRSGLVHALADLIPDLAPERIAFRDVADQDWTRVWMDQFKPMQFGRRVWIYPWNIEPPNDMYDQVVVRLDPGLAFGSGTHPTTALCLAWLDAAEIVGKTVIDYGCGSGILAIAALKLGAAHVIGIDNDPQALTASRDNAQRNGVSDRKTLHLPDDFTWNLRTHSSRTSSPDRCLIWRRTSPPVASRAQNSRYPGYSRASKRNCFPVTQPGSTRSKPRD